MFIRLRTRPLSHLRLVCLCAAAVLFAGPLAAIAGEPESAANLRARIDAAFVKYDPNYHNNVRRYRERLEAIATRLASTEATGNTLFCSQQMYLEARWLLKNTAHWDKLEDKLTRIEISLDDETQAFAREQHPVTGLWGFCYENPVLRLGETAQELERLASRGDTPRYKLRLTETTGKHLIVRLNDLLISDIAQTGIDHRGELGNQITALAQSAFKPYLSEVLPGIVELGPHTTMDGMFEAFRFFLAGAQDPETGYWGAWYNLDGEFVKTADLSITFHIIKYSKGDVAMWPKIVETTLAMEDDPYPYGWRSNGQWTNHNLYDVAAIFRYGWNYMTEEQKERVAAKIEEMLRWSLDNTIREDGHFIHDPGYSDSLANAYYFGISFLDIVGLWDEDERFWTDALPDDLLGKGDCERIHRSLVEMQFVGWAGDGARAKMARNCELG